MSLSIQDKQSMIDAKALIKQKEYHKANQLLKDIQHPTALRWRAQLKVLLEEQELGNPFIESSKSTSKDSSQKKKRKWVYVIGTIVIVVLLLAIMIPTVLMPRVNEAYKDIVKENYVLQFIDSPNQSAKKADGGQWQYNESNDSYSLIVGATAFSTAAEGASTRSFEEKALYMTMLTINCFEEGYIVGIVAVSPLKTVDDFVYATLVFDDDPAQTVIMSPAISKSGIFFRESKSALFQELLQSTNLLVQMPTVDGLNQYAKFDVSGFKNAVKQLENNCGPLPI